MIDSFIGGFIILFSMFLYDTAPRESMLIAYLYFPCVLLLSLFWLCNIACVYSFALHGD